VIKRSAVGRCGGQAKGTRNSNFDPESAKQSSIRLPEGPEEVSGCVCEVRGLDESAWIIDLVVGRQASVGRPGYIVSKQKLLEEGSAM